MTKLDQLTQSQSWLNSLRPLPPAVLAELRHRYDVALTYNSVAIEGNTLTRSETEIVIEKGITIAGKSIGEHLEVIGHKEALDFIIELSGDQAPLGQREIREIHSLVMKGQPNGDIGRYRTLDVQAAGSGFIYPSHLHLSELMTEFADWLATPTTLHPLLFTSEAHLRFVTIHPFRDGNGRVGRLVMNLLLLRAGYPIAVLPVAKRAEYIAALESAQAGKGREPLDNLLMQALAASLADTLTTALSSAELTVDPSTRQQIEQHLRRAPAVVDR